MGRLEGVGSKISILGEFLTFLRERKLWWMIPLILVLFGFGLILVAALSAYPALVPSSTSLANSLTIYNASSTPLTLYTMLVIALIGVPIMLGYTIFVYVVFKGKARPGEGYGAAVAGAKPASARR